MFDICLTGRMVVLERMVQHYQNKDNDNNSVREPRKRGKNSCGMILLYIFWAFGTSEGFLTLICTNELRFILHQLYLVSNHIDMSD